MGISKKILLRITVLAVVFILLILAILWILPLPPQELNLGFSIKKVQFTNPGEYVVSFDVNSKGDKSVALTIGGSWQNPNEFYGFLYIVNSKGDVLARKKLDGTTSLYTSNVRFGDHENIYLYDNNILPATASMKLDTELNSLPPDNILWQPEPNFHCVSTSGSCNPGGSWDYNLNDNIRYHYSCFVHDFMSGGCIHEYATVSGESKKLLFFDKSIRLTQGRNEFNDGGIMFIVGLYDASRSKEDNKLYILN